MLHLASQLKIKHYSIMSKLALSDRKNIKDHEANRDKHLATLNKATGLAFEIEVDWVSYVSFVKGEGYEGRIGEAVYDRYFGGLAANIAKICSEPMGKEAFLELCGKKTINFVACENSQLKGRYHATTFADGAITVSISKEGFGYNITNCGDDIEAQL